MIWQYAINYLLLAWDIFINPLQNSSTLWIVLPLILILLLIHIYFGRYPTENISWSTAFSNTISLLWVCIILFNYFISRYTITEILANPSLIEGMSLILVLTVCVILLMVINFYHLFPPKFMFLVSSYDSVYVLAYIVISLVTGFHLNKHVLISAGILFVILLILLQIIKKIIPKSAQSRRIETLHQHKKERKKAAKKAARTKKWNKIADAIKNVFK